MHFSMFHLFLSFFLLGQILCECRRSLVVMCDEFQLLEPCIWAPADIYGWNLENKKLCQNILKQTCSR